MAEQRLVQMFESLSGAIGSLSTAVGAQGVIGQIEAYSGEPKGFKDWIKGIEKYALLTSADSDQTKRIAYQGSKGAVSDFIHRYITGNPTHNWDRLKGELAAHFSEIQDSQHAFTILCQTKQKPSETVQVYAERLFALAQEAFANQQGALAAVENQMIGFFVDGLHHDYLKMKVMRENPDKFQTAVTVAMNEQNLRQRFNLRSNPHTANPPVRKEEPMEIGHMRPRKCYKCHKVSHIAKNCRSKGHVNAVNESHPQKSYHKFPRDGRQSMLCYYGNQLGHFKRECPHHRINQLEN